MLLMIDNYDSFTYNLVQYFGELGEQVEVFRNDELSIEDIHIMRPDRIVISPGPCTPNEAGVSMSAIKHFKGRIPILGVCLGHQCVAQFFGGKVVRAKKALHGKTSEVRHRNKGVFSGLPNPLTATRYHSLIVEESSLPHGLEVTASTDEGEIMGFKHREYDIEGVQFHPEAILTEHGHDLLQNFINPKF